MGKFDWAGMRERAGVLSERLKAGLASMDEAANKVQGEGEEEEEQLDSELTDANGTLELLEDLLDEVVKLEKRVKILELKLSVHRIAERK